MSEGGRKDISGVVGGEARENAAEQEEHGPGSASGGTPFIGDAPSNGANGPSNQSRSALYKRARAMGIAHTVAMTRDELIAAIEAASDIPAHIESANGAASGNHPPPEVKPNGHVDVEEPADGGAPPPKRGIRRRGRPAASRPNPGSATAKDAIADFDAARNDGAPRPAPAAPASQAEGVAEVEPRTDKRVPRDGPQRGLSVWAAARRQRLLLIVLGVLTVTVIGLSWAWVSYHKLTSDLQSSNSRVPAGVRQVLVPTGSITSTPATILFEGVNLSGRPRGSLLLLHTAPSGRVLSTLTLPLSTRVPNSGTLQEALNSAGAAGAVTLLDQIAGIKIRDVGIVNLAGLGQAVDELGGITVDVPVPIAYFNPPTGQRGTIPAGRITLNGFQTALFLRPREPSSLNSGERQNLVLRGLIEKLLRPTSLSGVQAVGKVMATIVATDLTASDVLDLASVRLGTDRLVSCAAPPSSEFGKRPLTAALNAFVHPSGTPSTSACRMRPIVAAPGGIVGSVSRQAVQNLPSILLTLLASSVTLWILAAVMLIVMVRRTLRASAMPALAYATAAGSPFVSQYRSSPLEPGAPVVEQDHAVDEVTPAAEPAQESPAVVKEPEADAAEPVVEPSTAPVQEPARQQHTADLVAEQVGAPEVEPGAVTDAERSEESRPGAGRGRRRRAREGRPAASVEEAPEFAVQPQLDPAPESSRALEGASQETAPAVQPRRVRRPIVPSLSRPTLPSAAGYAATLRTRLGTRSTRRPNGDRPAGTTVGGLVIPALLGAATIGLVFYVVFTVIGS
jgi:anionic cell wall polymer biosynthesis LytR-Cps2A-Psr (LCP) family protein